MIEPVKIEGLKLFTKNLKKIDKDLPKMVRLALNQASDTVVDRAVPKVPVKSGRARRTLKAQSTRSAARVAAGSRKAPYYAWLDFGGRVGKNKSVVRPFKKEGRYLYKAYFEAKRSGEFDTILDKALIEVAEAAGLKVR